MKNLYIQMWIENIDFQSENFETKERLIEEWTLKNVLLNEEKIEELFNKVLMKKGDWVDFNYCSSREQIHLDIRLLFTTAELKREDHEIINKSIELIELFISDINNSVITIPYEESELTKTSVLDREYEFLKIRIPGYTSFEIEEILANDLKNSKLKYTIEYTEISIHEAGASGGAIELLVMFVAGSVGSGITYDAIKMMIKSNSLFRNSELLWLKGTEFNYVRKEVAKRANIEPGELVLIEFSNEHSQYIFRGERNYIFAKFNNSKKIVEYKLSRSKREVIELFTSKHQMEE